MPYYVNDFTPEQVPLYDGFEPVDPGSYNCVITKAEMKDVFGKDVIKIRFKVIDKNSEFYNKLIFIDLNINNDHPDPEKRKKIKEMEVRKLNQICTICNAIQKNIPLDLEQLLNIPMCVHIGLWTNNKGKSNNSLYGVGKVKENYTNSITQNNDHLYAAQYLSAENLIQVPSENNMDDDIPF